MCSGLNPAFNVWDAVEPYANQLLRDEARSTVKEVAQQAWTTVGVTARLPQRIDAVITTIEQGEITFDTSRLERRLNRLERIGLRAVSALLFAGLLIGGALLLPFNTPVAIVLMVVSVIPLVHVLLTGFLERRGPQ